MTIHIVLGNAIVERIHCRVQGLLGSIESPIDAMDENRRAVTRETEVASTPSEYARPRERNE
jgi:hypothetical protein